MKTCPICGSKAISQAVTCFECLYNFKEMSAGVVLFDELEEAAKVETPVDTETELVNPPETEESLANNEKLMHELLIEMYQRGKLTCRYRSHSGSLYVGAANFNDIRINLPSIAKRHLHFYKSGEAVFAETLSVTCPVFLNGHSLDGAVPICSRDTISIGDIQFALSLSGE